MADEVDPIVAVRTSRDATIATAEAAISRGYWAALTRWLNKVRDLVMGPYRQSRGSIPPQPSMIPDTQLWNDLFNTYMMPEVEEAAWVAYRSILGDRNTFNNDPFMIAYLQNATARMVNLPLEVYGDITRILMNGLDAGQSVPEIADQIQERLTATGSDFWPNRAVVVARTEAVGATNAGFMGAAQERARNAGEEAIAEKVWVATLDARTRHTHVVADGQRVGLFEPFIVGGFPLQFPGDPTGPANEVIQCRCSLLDVVVGESVSQAARQFLEGDQE